MFVASHAFAAAALRIDIPAPDKALDQADVSSWSACISWAEDSRSDRDLEFFLTASNLIESKPWLVSHSRANENRFCMDILFCEEKYGEDYASEERAYPPC